MRSDTQADRSKGLSPKTEKQTWNQQSPQKARFTSRSVKFRKHRPHCFDRLG
jgi:hypothetical protein